MAENKRNFTETTPRNFEADQRICDAATEGPWYWQADVVRCGSADDQVRGMGIAFDTAITDARFIAEARTGWPAALERICELEAGLTETKRHWTHTSVLNNLTTELCRAALEENAQLQTDLAKERAIISAMAVDSNRYWSALERILTQSTTIASAQAEAYEALNPEEDMCARCGITPKHEDYAWCLPCRPELAEPADDAL